MDMVYFCPWVDKGIKDGDNKYQITTMTQTKLLSVLKKKMNDYRANYPNIQFSVSFYWLVSSDILYINMFYGPDSKAPFKYLL